LGSRQRNHGSTRRPWQAGNPVADASRTVEVLTHLEGKWADVHLSCPIATLRPFFDSTRQYSLKTAMSRANSRRDSSQSRARGKKISPEIQVGSFVRDYAPLSYRRTNRLQSKVQISEAPTRISLKRFSSPRIEQPSRYLSLLAGLS
jgi:hypothetical protein